MASAVSLAPPKGELARSRLRVKGQDLIFFTRQFATLLQAHVPVIQALDCLKTGADNPILGTVIGEVRDGISGGHTLSLMLSRFPKVFSNVYVSMVRVGEETGDLGKALDCLSSWQEKDHHILKKVQSALVYPAFLVLVTAVLTAFFMHSLLPQLMGMLSNHKNVPLLTQALLSALALTKSPYMWIVVAGVVTEGYLLWRRIMTRPESWRNFMLLLMRIPAVGAVLRNYALVRFCASMSAMLLVGMNLLPSLRIAAVASANPIVEEALGQVVSGIKDGGNLAGALAEHKRIFPKAFVHLLVAGEESGNIQSSFEYLQACMQEELELRLDAFEAAIGPVILMGAAFVVGLVVVAVFLPIYASIDSL